MYTITAPVPELLAVMIEPHRVKYDPQTDLIPAHLIILKPFDLSNPQKELYTHLEEIGEVHSPIKVSLVGWDIYQSNDYQLRLPIIGGKDPLMGLHKHILTGPLHSLAGKDDYWPHIPFGRFLKEEEMEQAKSSLLFFEPKFRFWVNHMDLWYRETMSASWSLIYQFALKGTVLSRPNRKIGA